MSTAQTAPAPVQKITTFLWFDDQAEEAMNFYVSIFKNSRVGDIVRYGDTGPGPKGQVMTADFVLAGQRWAAPLGTAYCFSPLTVPAHSCFRLEQLPASAEPTALLPVGRHRLWLYE